MQTLEDILVHVEQGLDHWIWKGGHSNGYPTGNWGGTTRSIPRVIWELEYGPLEKNEFIRVTCGVPGCVRLGHLGKFPGKVPEGQSVLEERAVTRFWSLVRKSPGSGCWVWTGYKLNSGYGRISIGSRTVQAHRYSYEINKGPVDPGKLVCHTCDNPICVRPDHLFQGTHRDNTQDMLAKGRNAKKRPRSWQSIIPDLAPRGETHHRSKLTDAQAEEIRAIFASGEMNQIELGKKFGVSNSTISLLVRGRRYGAKPEAPKVSEGPETRLQFMALGC